jgi:hypothetical protein
VEKENLEKYEKQESILGQRNSYSKTDNDQALNCSGCPLIEKCTKGNGNRTVSVNPNLEKHKEIARKNLSSEKGKVLRKRRAPEIETFFGDLKHNQKYRRIRLRGLDKANLEINYLAISYNLRKAAKKLKNRKTQKLDERLLLMSKKSKNTFDTAPRFIRIYIFKIKASYECPSTGCGW